MSHIKNSWIEKEKPKKAEKTSVVSKNDFKEQTKRPTKRHTPCLKMTMNRSLAGIRK